VCVCVCVCVRERERRCAARGCGTFFVNRDFVSEQETDETRGREKHARKINGKCGHALPVLQEARRASFL
jgi:hypothetical protein